MKKLFHAVLVSLGLVALLAGCGGSQRAAVTGVGVELAALERTPAGSWQATVRISNPNTLAYNVASATHRVFSGDQLIGTVRINTPTGVPAQRQIDQVGELEVTRGPVTTGQFRYRLESTLVLRLWGEETKSHKFIGQGTVEVQ